MDKEFSLKDKLILLIRIGHQHLSQFISFHKSYKNYYVHIHSVRDQYNVIFVFKF